MTKREIVKLAIHGQKPPYIPWNFHFTKEAEDKLSEHFKTNDLDIILHNHFIELGNKIGFYRDVGDNLVQDYFGVIWDRSC